jgi:ADP-ribose pyrophosphatase YjhB (NUDIX family)
MRHRATAIIIRDGKLLLVRDRESKRFSLPGGGLKHGEPSVSGAAREVSEELGLHPVEVKRLRDCDFEGGINQHHVCMVTVTGEPHIKEELNAFLWWDMKSPVLTFDHVTAILKKFNHSRR